MARRASRPEPPKPNVFLSWSGDRSHQVAKALHDWLPKVVDGVVPWLSTQGLASGRVWSAELIERLKSIKHGVFCVTPENLNASPWVLFEAGAIFKGQGRSRICTYFLGPKPDEVKGPFGVFQASAADEEGTWSVINSLNEKLAHPMSEDHLKVLFEAQWPALQAKIEKITQTKVAGGGETVKTGRVVVRPEATWTRLVPRLPIAEGRLNDLNRMLREIRDDAFKLVREKLGTQHAIVKDDVRACVFLPDTRSGSSRGFCELYIPDVLRVWGRPKDRAQRDQQSKEKDLRFGPGQGLAGTVFLEQEPLAERSDPANEGRARRWSPSYGLSEVQEDAVHRDLMWIVAFPLMAHDPVCKRSQAMGVLAVDGLKYNLEEDQPQSIIEVLFPKVALFAAKLAEEQKSRISLLVEDVSNG
jgi:hypothetical protein